MDKPKIEIAKEESEKYTNISEDQKKKFDTFISFPFTSAKELMGKLYSSDNFYETATYAWVGEKDAKKLFLYGVCKEVSKTCVSLINGTEFLQQIPKVKQKEPMEKMIFGSIIDEQSYRIRKMIELLALLILFDKKTKRDEEYRIYLNAENLDISISRQKEFKEFYEGEKISNVQRSLDDFSKRVSDDLSAIGEKELWFLDMNRFQSQKPSVFKSKRAIYLEALLLANDDERLSMGISYHKTYSRLSISAHPFLGSRDYGEEENDYKTVKSNFGYLSIISMHIMRLAYKIAGLKDPRGMEKIMGENLEKSEASKAMKEMKKNYYPGDIVLTRHQDLAEILEMKESKFGYEAYKIKFLSRSPIPEIPEDWREAGDILTKLVGRDTVRTLYEKSFAKTEDKIIKDITPKILEQSDEWLLKSAKAMYLDLHNNKILIPMLLESGHLKHNKK